MEKKAFSVSETKLLLDYIKKHKNRLENKATDAMTTAEKKRSWEVLTSEYNSNGLTPRKTSALQNKWKQLKKLSKKTISHNRRESEITGGGSPSPTPKFLPESIQNLVESITSSITLRGNENVYDSNSDFSYLRDKNNNGAMTHIEEEIVMMDEAMVSEESEPEEMLQKNRLYQNPLTEIPLGSSKMDNLNMKSSWDSYKPAMLKTKPSQALQVPLGKPKRNYEQYQDNLSTKNRVLQLQESYYSEEQIRQEVITKFWQEKTKNERAREQREIKEHDERMLREARKEQREIAEEKIRLEREARKEARSLELHKKRMQKEEDIITQNRAIYAVRKALLQTEVNKCLQK